MNPKPLINIDIENPLVRAYLEREGVQVPDMKYDERIAHALIAACKNIEGCCHHILGQKSGGLSGYTNEHTQLRIILQSMHALAHKTQLGLGEWADRVASMLHQVNDLQSKNSLAAAKAFAQREKDDGHEPN